jgi:hypothetical protein
MHIAIVVLWALWFYEFDFMMMSVVHYKVKEELPPLKPENNQFNEGALLIILWASL